MNLIKFECNSCKKENVVSLQDIAKITAMGQSGVSLTHFGIDTLMGSENMAGLLSGFAGRIPRNIGLNCNHCGNRNIIEL
jgi:ribosomal protein L33